jgi:hypothetical protein
MLLIAALLVCALGAGAFFAVRHRQRRVERNSLDQQAAAQPVEASNSAAEKAPLWMIRGALTEACTCAVPCTCNFGEGPSPHAYCYPFYSFDIREGHYGETRLDGLRFGSADLRHNRAIFIDERADERQRAALRLIAMRVIGHFAAEEAEAKARELDQRIRYAAIKQEYDGRHNHLEVAGIGEFSADYIMGMDKSQPVTVRNNTTWRIHEAIKARTSHYRVQVGRDVIRTKNTNSNQGEFEYTDKTDFGAPAQWNCGACASRAMTEGAQSKEAVCH